MGICTEQRRSVTKYLDTIVSVPTDSYWANTEFWSKALGVSQCSTSLYITQEYVCL